MNAAVTTVRIPARWFDHEIPEEFSEVEHHLPEERRVGSFQDVLQGRQDRHHLLHEVLQRNLPPDGSIHHRSTTDKDKR